ncbi:MAG: hypothetical protein HFG29_09895 [Eubacterium sp.]|nr:hypothetical protein [Eubacterium sp.]
MKNQEKKQKNKKYIINRKIIRQMRKVIETAFIASVVCFMGFITAEANTNIDISTTKTVDKQIKEGISFTKVSSTKTGTKIKWNTSKKYKGYVIYRSINNGKFKEVDIVSKKQYTDVDIETGESYRYQIKPFYYKKNKRIYEKRSVASDSYLAKPYGVDNVHVVTFKDHKYVSWDLNELASGYKILRKKDNEGWKEIVTLAKNTDAYEDYNIVMTGKYQYRVAAIENVDGQDYISVYSTSVNVGDLKGIDVSYHNGKIDWKKVRKAGISFAMIRMGYGTSKGGIIDSCLDYNYKNARKNGIKVGFYLYSYADNVREARNEAKFTYRMLKKYNKLDFPMAFDFENPYRNKMKYKKSNTKIITTYCNYLEKKGFDTSVYSYMDFFHKAVDYKKVSKYGIWLARWTNSTKNFNDGNIPNVQMWQYSAKGKVSGIKTAVDLNLNIVQ